MLRVLSLGLSLPRSIFHTSHPLHILLSPCALLSYFPKSSQQVRLASDSPAKRSEPPDAGQGRDEKSSGPKLPFGFPQGVEGWKSRFIRHEVPRKPIRPLRQARPPPKYSRPPEKSEASGEVHVRAKNGVARIVVHPAHRSPQGKDDDPTWDSSLEDILPESMLIPEDADASKRKQKRMGRDALLQVLSETQSISEAWEAYSVLLAKHTPRLPLMFQNQGATNPVDEHVDPEIPYAHLHRLARLLSSTRPRTRDLFLRLLSVLTTLRTAGGTVFVWEWNALIDCAGKGWRKTNIEDYRAAVGIFKDMLTSGQASSSHPPSPPPSDTWSEYGDMAPAPTRLVAQPDIVSFTTLLDIASRTNSETAIIHATSLLDASGLPWNQITHMARLQYFIRTNQVEAVRDILRETVHRGLDSYTLNGCLWAFARWGRLRVALQVYELLRCNIPASDRANLGPDLSVSSDLEGIAGGDRQEENPILNIPGFVLPITMQPDRVTYGLLIQALCYHGDLVRAVKVFRDMISTIDPATRPVHPVGRPEEKTSYYIPSLIIYRAIFLGFARHAHKRPSLASNLTSRRRYIDLVPLPDFAARLTPSDSISEEAVPSPQEGPKLHDVDILTLENLDTFFENFLELDWDHNAVIGESGTPARRPSDRMIYWIMVAYAKTTRRDVGKMYKVWQQLDARFGYGEDGVSLWGGRLVRIAEALEKRQGHSNTAQDNITQIDPNG